MFYKKTLQFSIFSEKRKSEKGLWGDSTTEYCLKLLEDFVVNFSKTLTV